MVTGQTSASVNAGAVPGLSGGTEMYEERQQRRSTGALTEPLDIYFTISHCCKTKRETEREGEKKISPRSYFPHSGKLQAAQLHYTCTEQSVWQRFTKRRNTLSLTA